LRAPRRASISTSETLRPPVADGLEGGDGAFARVGEAAEVLLGGGDLSVAEAVHDDFEVGAAGEQPRGVRATQVVEADTLA